MDALRVSTRSSRLKQNHEKKSCFYSGIHAWTEVAAIVLTMSSTEQPRVWYNVGGISMRDINTLIPKKSG